MEKEQIYIKREDEGNIFSEEREKSIMITEKRYEIRGDKWRKRKVNRRAERDIKMIG
jgi:hypothetical protein